MRFAFRRVSSMRKLMWASLAVNLFLIGALAGSVLADLPLFDRFMSPPLPSGFEEKGDPPGVRLLKNVRSHLSDEGQVIFDAEFNDLIEEMRNNTIPRFLMSELRKTLDQANASDAEILGAYDVLKISVFNELDEIFDGMATVAVKLAPEDRSKMTLIEPHEMPQPRPD